MANANEGFLAQFRVVELSASEEGRVGDVVSERVDFLQIQTHQIHAFFHFQLVQALIQVRLPLILSLLSEEVQGDELDDSVVEEADGVLFLVVRSELDQKLVASQLQSKVSVHSELGGDYVVQALHVLQTKKRLVYDSRFSQILVLLEVSGSDVQTTSDCLLAFQPVDRLHVQLDHEDDTSFVVIAPTFNHLEDEGREFVSVRV